MKAPNFIIEWSAFTNQQCAFTKWISQKYDKGSILHWDVGLRPWTKASFMKTNKSRFHFQNLTIGSTKYTFQIKFISSLSFFLNTWFVKWFYLLGGTDRNEMCIFDWFFFFFFFFWLDQLSASPSVTNGREMDLHWKQNRNHQRSVYSKNRSSQTIFYINILKQSNPSKKVSLNFVFKITDYYNKWYR